MKFIAYIFKPAEWGLWCLMAYLLSRVLLLWLAPESVALPTYNTHLTKKQPTLTQSRIFTSRLDPFHRLNTPGQSRTDAPETTLDLKVRGRRFSPSGGSATIETPDGQQKVYILGDEIMQDVILKNVTQNYIILERNKQLERLSLDYTQTQILLPTLVEHNPHTSHIQDLASLLDVITLESIQTNGSGIRIHSIDNTLNLNSFGLQEYDIITHINGQSVDNMQTIANARAPLNLRVQRNGQPITVKINLP